MYSHMIRAIFRNLRRFRLYTLINVFGLALGLACALLIMHHVQYEFDWDKSYSKSDQLYRVTLENNDDAYRHWAVVSPVAGEELPSFFSQIESVARTAIMERATYVPVIDGEDGSKIDDSHSLFADPSIFEMFDFQAVEGDLDIALDEEHSIVLTKSMADKLFGGRTAFGQTVRLEGLNIDLTVSAVIEDQPANTHLQFSALLPLMALKSALLTLGYPDLFAERGWSGVYTYLQLPESASVAEMQPRFDDFLVGYFENMIPEDEVRTNLEMHFQPITDIHLKSNLEQDFGPKGSYDSVRILIAASILLLLVAAVNYVIHAIMLLLRRIREIGIRRVVGAQQYHVIIYVVTETLLITGFAALLALAMIELAAPGFEHFAGHSVSAVDFFSKTSILVTIAIVVFTALLASLYPAYLSGKFGALHALRGSRSPVASQSKLRSALIQTQVIISVILIFGTIVIGLQLRYTRTMDLGFTPEGIIAVPLNTDMLEDAERQVQPFLDELRKQSGVVAASVTTDIPGTRISMEGFNDVEGYAGDDMGSMRFHRTDEGFVDVMDLNILEGRNFNPGPEGGHEFIINKTAADRLNLETTAGTKAISMLGKEGTIVGVVEDYYFASLHLPMEPLILSYDRTMPSYIMVRHNSAELDPILHTVKRVFQTVDPEYVFDPIIVTDQLADMYAGERRLNNLLNVFTILSLIVASLGLFGLASLSAEQKQKEVGVRRAMGATTWQILRLFWSKHIRRILIANVIALPVAWFLMLRWLENFAYHIEIPLLIALLPVVITLGLALMTTAYHSLRMANIRPATALRDE
jgi:putative ABC transport system permease protein